VHELLQTEFGLEHGLADTTTWGEMLKKHPEMKLPPLTDAADEKRTISPDEFFVQVLDPATGTATFLVETIDTVYRHLKEKWDKAGAAAMPHLPANCKLNTENFAAWWNCYVPAALLPRLHGYELLMAPYAIAHMKIGLKLAETKYHFGSEERARIYLTNALEPWVKQLPLIGFDALAHEAAEVNEVKRHKRFTVVIGNPPYSNFGQLNRTDFLLRLLEDYKRGLNEKKLNLDDDFIKFIRYGQHVIQQSGVGALGLITNNVFLDGLTHRQMRRSLRESFTTTRILDLHGSARKLETGRGSGEENVFEIQQGVAVEIFSRHANDAKSHLFHADMWGTRDSKYWALNKASMGSTTWNSIESPAPNFFFVPKIFETGDDFESYPNLKEIFITSGNAIKTERDRVSIHFTPEGAEAAVKHFRTKDEAFLRREYDLETDSRDWKVANAKADVCENRSQKLFRPILYRPFDIRHTWYSGQTRGFIGTPAYPTMKHLIAGANIAMACLRQTRRAETGTYLVGRGLIGKDIVSIFDIGTVFPLYLYEETLSFDLGNYEVGDAQATERRVNFSTTFLKQLAIALELPHERLSDPPASLTPEDIFNYIYAVFHSPGYRTRYAEFLKIDFPRLPLTGSLDLFRTLAKFGGELVALHLLESPKLDKPITEFIGKGREVVKVGYTDGTVWIDAGGTKAKTSAGTSGFFGVPEEVWNFHIGGYQVCEKWLKDRKSRTLTKDDIAHYHKIVIALSETIRLMAEIDKIIDQHGGWPGAFSTANAKAS
jgi:predicted helicase